MLDEINRIANSDFTAGKRKPRNWTWNERAAGVSWEPTTHAGNGDSAGVRIRGAKKSAEGEWSQTFTVKKEQHYRIEAVVSCDCTSADGGLVLSLTPIDQTDCEQETLQLPPLRQADRFILRAYYCTPPGIRRARLAVGLRGEGSAVVHDVRVLPVLEPDARSHPWAVPPPPYANTAPVAVRRICVCTRDANRPIIGILRTRFGNDAVTVHNSAKWHKSLDQADAILLLDGPIPAKLRRMRGIKEVAARRIVIASLSASEKISDEQLITRKVSQLDDPLHARVAHADFITAGFALRDIVPFAGQPDDAPKMHQRQYRTNKVFRQYCEKHDLKVLLESETDAEATSEKPIALYRRTERGAIIFVDVEPAEAIISSLTEPMPAVQMLFNALGVRTPLVGQFFSPARSADDMLSHLRDSVERFPALAFTDESTLFDPHAPRLILMGRSEEKIGLPITPRPLLLVRSGLTGADTSGIYGTMLWLKQMLRPDPFVSPYAHTLDREFRIGWMPLAAPLHAWGGWQPEEPVARFPLEFDFEPGSIAAAIDITTAPQHRVRVVAGSQSRFAATLRDALPTLAAQLIGDRHFYHAGRSGFSLSNRIDATWRTDDLRVEVAIDGRAFPEAWQAQAASAGAELLRIELPDVGAEPAAHSIWQTDWIATLLELTTGLMLGTVIVNREAVPLDLQLPDAVANLLDRTVMRRINEPRADLPVPAPRKGRLQIPPAHALIAIR